MSADSVDWNARRMRDSESATSGPVAARDLMEFDIASLGDRIVMSPDLARSLQQLPEVLRQPKTFDPTASAMTESQRDWLENSFAGPGARSPGASAPSRIEVVMSSNVKFGKYYKEVAGFSLGVPYENDGILGQDQYAARPGIGVMFNDLARQANGKTLLTTNYGMFTDARDADGGYFLRQATDEEVGVMRGTHHSEAAAAGKSAMMVGGASYALAIGSSALSFATKGADKTVTLYRVDDAGFAPRIAADGSVPVVTTSAGGERALFVNIGQPLRAQEFALVNRGGNATVTAVQVDVSLLEKLRTTAVYDKGEAVRLNPTAPLKVDINKAPDQFGLRTPEQIQWLRDAIKPDTVRAVDPRKLR